MTDIELLHQSPRKVAALLKKGFRSVEDVIEEYPKEYYDCSVIQSISKDNAGKIVALKVTKNDKGNYPKVTEKKSANNHRYRLISMKGVDGGFITVFWYRFMTKDEIEKINHTEVFLVCGTMQYSEEYNAFSMVNPFMCEPFAESLMKIYTQYRKIDGISEDTWADCINNAVLTKETYAEDERIITNKKKHGLMCREWAIKTIHYPSKMKFVKAAKDSMAYSKIFNYKDKLIKEHKESVTTSNVALDSSKVNALLRAYYSLLPFPLTTSQKEAISDMLRKVYKKEHLRGLVQGDVGSGKTVVAFSMLFTFASCGYQSVLMAPTQILAEQHYAEMCRYAEKVGVKVALLTSTMKAKEKNLALESIKTGETKVIIGTSSCISSQVEYKNLALAVIDEEHRFGVEQRDAFDKLSNDLHKVSMSATPIPRTLARALYENLLDIYYIEQPSSRKKTITRIVNKRNEIFEMIKDLVKEKNQQVYVVCPMIEENDNIDIVSVNEIFSLYTSHLKPFGIKIDCVSGKTPEKESEVIIQKFKDGVTDVLISTTMIEVGVNVPNANLIIIENAERFGLSTLHQLRGRVGRGSKQGYCYLVTNNSFNQRLSILTETNDGSVIAEEDLKLRGSGNIIGLEQSGQNGYLELIIEYPEVYEMVQKDLECI